MEEVCIRNDTQIFSSFFRVSYGCFFLIMISYFFPALRAEVRVKFAKISTILFPPFQDSDYFFHPRNLLEWTVAMRPCSPSMVKGDLARQWYVKVQGNPKDIFQIFNSVLGSW